MSEKHCIFRHASKANEIFKLLQLLATTYPYQEIKIDKWVKDWWEDYLHIRRN